MRAVGELNFFLKNGTFRVEFQQIKDLKKRRKKGKNLVFFRKYAKTTRYLVYEIRDEIHPWYLSIVLIFYLTPFKKYILK